MTSLATPSVDSPPPPSSVPGGQGLLVGLLAAAVVLAFADASVVVLALPDMYGEYETTIVGVSWVIAAYALVVAAAGFALACFPGRSPRWLTAAGLGLFGVASTFCATAPDVGWLVGARCAQGLGGALLLVGALDVLRWLDPARGQRIWAVAGTVGLAVGPALGGVLTDLFAWRTVFVVQAPVALLAVVVARLRRQPEDPTTAAGTAGLGAPKGAWRSLALANTGLLLVSASLVGALFLAVLLVIEVWQFTPIGGALVVSALPAGALVAGRLRDAPPLARAGGGCLLLAGGLAGLALLPSASPWWAAACLAVCGAGFGLATGILDTVADGTDADTDVTPDGSPSPNLRRQCALAIGSRHAGLVVGLALFAPLLATDLDRGAEQAALTGARTLLDARLNLSDKISVARTLRDEVDRTPRGEMPDLNTAFADADPDVVRAGTDLRRNIEAVLSRAFRTEFVVAGGLALLAAGPGLLLARRIPRRPNGRRPRQAGAAVAALLAGSMVLLAGEAGAGGADFGRYEARDPCRAPPESYAGKGFDATIQRIVLSGLDGAACDLDVTREALVLSLDGGGKKGLATIDWDRKTIEDAVRAGLVRAVDDADERDSIPGWAAGPLKELAKRAPIQFALGTVDVVQSGLDMFKKGLEGLKDLFG